MTDRDPPRLFDDPSTDPALRDAMRDLAQHAPPLDTAAGLARLESAMSARKAISFLAVGGVGVAILAGGLLWATMGTGDPEPRPEIAAPAPAPATESREPAPVPEAEPVAAAPVRESAVAEARETVPRETVARETVPREAAPRETVPRESAPRGTVARESVARESVAPETPSREDLLALEMAQLAEARAALDAHPARALALLDDGRRRYPASLFGEERAALRVLALAALHRDREARIEGARFLSAHPESPFAARVRRAIEEPAGP